MSLTSKEVARRHLTLAEGLIETTRTNDTPSEYEIRNAFSRSYYALFHASHGYLRAAEVDVDTLGKKQTHGSLFAEMARWMGKSFGQFLRDSYELRRKSDYQTEWPLPPDYWCVDKLKAARRQCYFVMVTARKLIS